MQTVPSFGDFVNKYSNGRKRRIPRSVRYGTQITQFIAAKTGAEALRHQQSNVGKLLSLTRPSRYPVMAELSQPTYQRSQEVRVRLIAKKLLKLVIPRMDYGLDEFDWSILKVIFQDTMMEVFVRSFTYEMTSNLGGKCIVTFS